MGSKLNQNKTLRAGFALVVVALITLVALSFTFAKYVSTGTGTDNARVAKWGLNIPIDSDLKLFSDAYKADGTPSAYDASGNIVKADTQNQRVIAPGTLNTVDVKLANDTAPEVMYDFNIKLKIEDLTTQPGTTQESLIQLLDNYAPWKWTLGDQEFNNFLAFENAVNNLTQKDVPPNHLPDTKNIILGWKWDFDDDGAGTYDTYDTSMGNAAVVDAITHLKVSLNVEAVQCQGCTPATKTLTGITVTNAPTKTIYNVGDAFDSAGMVITASYSDGTTADVTGYTFSPETLNIPGEQTVTIFYTEGGVTKTISLQVTVKVFEKATVKTPPSSIPSLTYNGNPQTIANPGEAENGTMMYAVTKTDTKPTEKTSFKKTIDQKTDAGDYYLWYYAKGDAGYDDSDIAGSVVCPIDRADIDYPEAATGLVYTGGSLTGVSAGTGYELFASHETGTKEPTIKDGNAQGVDAGTYGVKASLDGNHKWTEDPTTEPYNLIFTIAKADSNMTFELAKTKFSSRESADDVSQSFDAATGASGIVTYEVFGWSESNVNDELFPQVVNAALGLINNLTGNTDNESDKAINETEYFKINDGEDLTINTLTCKANTPKAYEPYKLILKARDSGDGNHNSKEISVGEDQPVTWTVEEPIAATVPYVVSLWGLDHEGDHKEGQHTGTFGPATDASKLQDKGCDESHEHCIHRDSWQEIKINIEAGLGEEYYGNCIANGCTKDIELELNSSIANAQANTYNRVSVLYNSIKTDYKKWNYSYDGDKCESANYATSRMRATLNGYKPYSTSADTEAWWKPSDYAQDASHPCLAGDTCLLSCFPEDLQGLIVPKTFTVPTEWSTSSPYNIDESKNVVVEDKLWLANANETYTSPGTSYQDYGSVYTKFDDKGDNTHKGYFESGNAAGWWLRSSNRTNRYNAANVGSGGPLVSNYVNNTIYGLAPCFCL